MLERPLGWIVDLYQNADEIRSYGQTIVYSIHESVGHLGTFVSAGMAKKEYDEFSSNIDVIDTLPPGLYEAVFESKTGDTANPDLVPRQWIMLCETRTLDDIRALGGNDPADERRFATAARVWRTMLPFTASLRPSFSGSCARPCGSERASESIIDGLGKRGRLRASPRSLDELAKLRTHTAHYSPVMIAPCQSIHRTHTAPRQKKCPRPALYAQSAVRAS